MIHYPIELFLTARTSQLDSEEVTSFAYDRLAKRRLVDTLKDSIVRKAQTLSSSSAADTLLKRLLAMSKLSSLLSLRSNFIHLSFKGYHKAV